LEALQKFSSALQRFAATQGKPGLYHETITWAYMFLIRERMLRAGRPMSWEEVATANPELLSWERESGCILATYYPPETLKSEVARSALVLRDKIDRVA